MKTLELIDLRGNRASYELCLPDEMERWNVGGLLEFLNAPLEHARSDGFLVHSPERLRHETLRRLVRHASSTFQRPIEWVQHGVVLDPFDFVDTSAPHTKLFMERDETASRGNPLALSLAEANRRAFEGGRPEVVRCIDALCGFSTCGIRDRSGQWVGSFAQLVDGFEARLDRENQLRVLFRLAETVHAHPFENISKMISGVPFCSGWEMWGRMEQGGGGICAEKTAALKFVLDVLGVETFYVAGSSYSIPNDFERRLKDYVREEGCGEPPLWIQHLLLGFRLGEEEFLTDVSNGNLPLLFLSGVDLQRYLSAGYRARMVFHVERMNLKRISSWAGDALLTLCEFHVPDLHFQYIFKQALGLHISSTAYIGAFFDYGGIRSARYQAHYAALSESLRLPYPRFIHEENLSSLPDAALQKVLKNVLDALRKNYANRWYTGDFTFVVQPLNRRPISPRISRELRPVLRKGES